MFCIGICHLLKESMGLWEPRSESVVDIYTSTNTLLGQVPYWPGSL